MCGLLFFYQIKRKRERKIGGRQKQEENFIVFSYTRNYVLICSIHYFFNGHTRLSYFSWLKEYINLQISKTVRFIISFLFSLYDEYKCFVMLISYDYLV